MHTENEPCETEVLARSQFCIISRCKGCKTFHLHLGAVSVRLREEMFGDLCGTLAGAFLEVSGKQAAASSPQHNH
jgi:hypothetical protein